MDIKKWKTLEDYREQVWGCARCNWCQNVFAWNVQSSRFNEICPAFFDKRFAAYSGMGKMHIARALMEGEFDYDESPMLLDIIYRCSACGGCQINCQRIQEKEPLKVIEALREKLVNDGIGPMPAHNTVIKSMEDYENPYQAPPKQKNRWARGLDVPVIDPDKSEKREVLYYVGCTAAYDPRTQQMAKDTVCILQKAGVDFGILGNQEACCGSTCARIGATNIYKNAAQKNIEMFNNIGVKTIVTSCSGCYRTFKWEYGEIGKIRPEVFHVTQYIESLVREGKLEFKNKVKKTVTWHDPCHLGRLGGVYDEPRNVLEAIPGVKLMEMERIKNTSWCCGAGGGARTALPDFAVRIAQERLEEAKNTGAEVLATQCPFCKTNFVDADGVKPSGLEILDLTTLVRKAIE